MTERYTTLTRSPAAACGCKDGERRKGGRGRPRDQGQQPEALRAIEGQVRGLQKMSRRTATAPHPHPDLLAQEALRAVGREMMRNHLKHCAATHPRRRGEA